MKYMEKLKEAYYTIPGLLRNKYLIVIVAFAVWMTFFDNYNFIYRAQIYGDLREARAQKQYYKEQIKEVKSDLKDLFSNNASLERFAREKYYMKREDEDVFIIVEK